MKLKKLMSVLLSLALLCACIPLGAIPVAAATSGTTGRCTWRLDGTHLTISGKGEMGNYSYYSSAPWGTSISSVTIEDGVTTIGVYAFYKCTALTSVTIPDSVYTIGGNAFYYCDSLVSVIIGDSVTTIGCYAFSECTALESVTIGNSVTIIESGAFDRCKSLISVTIPDSVTTIEYAAFYSCGSLTSVCISDIEAWCTIDFENIFSNPLYYAENLYLNDALLTNLIIPDNVTTIAAYVFYGCESLQSVTIGDSVTTIEEGAFECCDALQSVTIPDGVITIGNEAFNDCETLKSVTIPNSVITIGEAAFAGCDSLKSVSIPDSVITIGDKAFYACRYLTSAIIGDGVTTIGEYTFWKCDRLTSVIIGDGVTAIGDYAFKYCDSLTSVSIPNSVITIGGSAFCGCDSLKSVTIGDSVTTIGESAFEDCVSLESVHYHGSKEECEAISIGGSNSNLIDATWHYYDNACDADCNDCGITRIPFSHRYSNACDAYCNLCGEWRKVEHTYEVSTEEATCGKDGLLTYTCTVCGDTYTEAIPATGNHIYDNACDVDCNVCGAVRDITHTFDNACDATCNVCGTVRTVPDHVYDDEYDADCNECGATREVPEKPADPNVPATGSATIDFGDIANRVSYSTKQQVWTRNGITVTNDKAGSTSNVGDYGGDGYPVRFYKGSSLLIEYAGMTKIVFNCDDYRTSYPTDLQNSITVGTVTVDGTVVTVTFGTPVDSLVIESLAGQVRVLDITVYGDVRTMSTPGDADGDGKITTRDVALLQQYLAGWDVTLNEAAAYADGDGRITTRDVALLQQYLAGWNVTLGV